MKFSVLKMENWLVYKGVQELHFPQDNHANILLIFGENMHGKTSLLNAVRWALYGEALNRQKKVVQNENLLNTDARSDGEKRFAVELSLVSDGIEYLITREASLEASGVHVSLTLRKDGRVEDGATSQASINDLVSKQISQFLLFDGELLNQFEELVIDEGSAQASSIKSAIEKALGLPVLQRAEREIGLLSKDFSKAFQAEMKKKNNLQVLMRNLEKHQSDLDSKQKEKNSLEDSIEENRMRLLQLDEEIEKASQSIELSERKKLIQAQRTANLKTIEETNQKSKAEMAKLWLEPLSQALKPRRSEIEEKINSLSLLRQQNAISLSKIEELKKSITESVCTECGQRIDAKNQSAIEQRISALKETISEPQGMDKDLADLQNSLAGITLPLDFKDVSPRLIQMGENNTRLTRENIKIENDLLDIRNELAGFDEEKGRQNKKEYDMRRTEIGRLGEKIKTVQSLIEKIEFEIEQIKKHPDLEAERGKGGTTARMTVLDGLHAIFKSSVEKYRDSMRQKVGRRASETFENLTTEKEFDELKINNSYGLNLIINGQQVTRSAGAEQIVALSLIEALNHLGRRKGPMLMDTPAGRLDKSHRKNVMDYLPSVVTQLAFFAHSGELDDENIYFDRSRIGKKYRINRMSSFQSNL